MSADARADVRQASDYYERQQVDLRRRFVGALVDGLNAVVDRPDSFPVVHADLRRAMLATFPYGIFFRRRGDVIRMIGVVHLHRDPKTWRRRR